MSVSMVFCYTQWCADKTAWVMKTFESEEGEGKGFTAQLHEKCSANGGLVVRTAILGRELAAEGAITSRVSSKTAN